MLTLGEERIVPRVSDVYAAVPSITGKLELEYEGELQGGDAIARELIRRAAGKVLEERIGGADLGQHRGLVRSGRRAQGVAATSAPTSASRASRSCPGLLELVSELGLAPKADHPRAVAACELVLEGLAAQKRISRSRGAGLHPRASRERRESRGYGKGGGMSASA